MGRGLFLGIAIATGFGIACGNDKATNTNTGGCTTDVECKGDRICVKGECVDPNDGEVADAGSGASTGGHGASTSTGGTGSAGHAAATGGSRAGASGSGGSKGTGGMTVIDDPELEDACSLDCRARKDAACPMDIGSLDQCLGQCLVVDEQTQGYCLDEMTARYACLASGGYSCVSGYPQPKATCLPEAQALSTCTQMTPCRAFCARAAGACAPAGDECLTSCMMQQSSFDDAICGIYYTQLLSCWGQDLSCENGRPAVGKCGPQIAEVADCVGRRKEACDGFCWAADTIGCGTSDCLTSCKAKTGDSACGTYYRLLIECSYERNELALKCDGGAPVPDTSSATSASCASYQMQYESCMMRQ